MNLRKLTSWFPELSYRQKVVSLILSGVIVGLGGLFLAYGSFCRLFFCIRCSIAQIAG